MVANDHGAGRARDSARDTCHAWPDHTTRECGVAAEAAEDGEENGAGVLHCLSPPLGLICMVDEANS